MADSPDSPDRGTAVVIADEVALGVNRCAAGAVTANEYPATGVMVGTGLNFRSGSKKREGGDCERG
jgi:hypothetical protein